METYVIKRLKVAEKFLIMVFGQLQEGVLDIVTEALDRMEPGREKPEAWPYQDRSNPPHVEHVQQKHKAIKPAPKIVRSGRVHENGPQFTSPRTIFDNCRNMAKMDREYFTVFHLDGKKRTIGKEVISIGSLNQSIVHPREVFRAAVHNGSASLILVHNHPTGDPTPSFEDRSTTQRLREAGRLIGIEVLDHIIIGDGHYHSFVEEEASAAAKKQRRNKR